MKKSVLNYVGAFHFGITNKNASDIFSLTRNVAAVGTTDMINDRYEKSKQQAWAKLKGMKREERLAYLKEELGTVTPYMEKHIEEFTGDAGELNELGKSVFQLGRKSAEAGLKEQNRRRRKGMGLEN